MNIINNIYLSDVGKLLCTFSPKEDITITIDRIHNTYADVDRIFILSLDKTNELACTYSTDSMSNLLVNTIKINRHSTTNTIYTVNALNKLTNNTRANIDWESYINRAILVSKHELLIHKITLHDIINI